MRSLTIGGGPLTASFLPAVAGKLVSLRSTVSGREWLWRHPVLTPAPPGYGGSYVRDMDSGGWDEVFPSVSPGRVEGREIPDHGDAAQLPWEVVAASAHAVTLAVTMRYAPCRLERRVAATARGLRVDYTLTGSVPEGLPYLWCAHPLLALEPGMMVRVAAGSRWRCAGGVGVPAGVDFAWPAIPGAPGGAGAAGFRIPDPAAGAPFAAKLFSAAGAVSEIALTPAAGDETLRFAWDVSEIPHLALWLNAGAWSGVGDTPYFNLGLEPATAPHDALACAIASGSARRLFPAGSHRWSLWVELDSAGTGLPAAPSVPFPPPSA